MRNIIVCFILATFLRPCIAAEAADPIRDYTDSHSLASGRVIYKWELDLNHSGQKEILLSIKPTAAELEKEERETRGNIDENLLSFRVYIPSSGGASYIRSKGTDEDGVLGIGEEMGVEITQCYVGYIAQLKRWGLVTIESDGATDKVPAEARIYAYTIEGDHIKRALLAKYNPDKGGNAIYDQYLKEGKRTKVQLQEVTL